LTRARHELAGWLAGTKQGGEQSRSRQLLARPTAVRIEDAGAWEIFQLFPYTVSQRISQGIYLAFYQYLTGNFLELNDG